MNVIILLSEYETCLRNSSPFGWDVIRLKEIIVKNIVTWDCHMDESSKVGYDIILGKYILT